MKLPDILPLMSEQVPSFRISRIRSVAQVVHWNCQPRAYLERSKLLTQLAIPGGIHSCFVTTALNGGIVTGNLSPDEAAHVQVELTDDRNRGKWGERQIHGRTLLTWQGDLAAEVGSITGREFPFRYVDTSWCDFDTETLPTFLRERLAQGYALSWGDETHQRLAVGISENGATTETVDPYVPLAEQSESVEVIAAWHRPASPLAIIGRYAVVSEQEIVRQFR